MAQPPHRVQSAAEALRIIALAMRRPLAHETICFALDDHGNGGVAVAIDGTIDPDAVLDVIEILGRAAEGSIAASLVVGSIRPDSGLLDDDVARWHEIDALSEAAGLTLLEWFVVDRDERVHLPRLLVDEASRWPIVEPLTGLDRLPPPASGDQGVSGEGTT